MPSPLKGLMDPAASPTTKVVAPTLGPTASPIGSLPPVGAPSEVDADSSHSFGAQATKWSISVEVLTPFHRWSVERSPTPTLTRPSPKGKIHPYPGTTSPSASR